MADGIPPFDQNLVHDLTPSTPRWVQALQRPTRRLAVVVGVLTLIALNLIAGVIIVFATSLDKEVVSSDRRHLRVAIEGKRDNLATLAFDYSWWDVIIENAVDTIDLRWADDNIGSYLTDTFGVENSYVIDPENEIVIAFLGGKVTDGLSFADHFPPEVAKMLALARVSPWEKPESVSSLVAFDDGVRMVAAAAITPETAPAESERGGRHVLLLMQPIGSDLLGRWGSDYGLSGIRFLVGKPAQGFTTFIVNNIFGKPVATIGWRSETPGMELLIKLWPALLLATVTMLFMVWLLFRRTSDLARQKEVLESLRARDRELVDLKSRFVSMVTHEIRSPLQTIRSAAGTLERFSRELSDEEQRQEIQSIDGSVQVIDGLVNNVLNLGAIESGRWELTPGFIDVVAETQRIWQQVGRQLDVTQELHCTHEGNCHSVPVDAEIFNGVVRNLLSNAAKFSDPQYPIEVAFRRVDGGLQSAVRDLGCGVPVKDLDMVFAPFHRGGNARSVPGTGIGLTVVKSAVEYHGGRIDLINRPDGGVEVGFFLPDVKATPLGNLAAEKSA